MRHGISFAGTALSVVLVVLGLSIFTVDQRQHAIIFQLGEVKEVITEPGLYFKWPLIQNVRYFDKRILTMDSNEPERFITSEKKNVLVDSFVKWRITDPQLYYVSVAGDEARARTRLSQTVNAGLRDLDAHEEHLMRKIADLLYVGHADYVAAKQRAREIAKLPANLSANLLSQPLGS